MRISAGVGIGTIGMMVLVAFARHETSSFQKIIINEVCSWNEYAVTDDRSRAYDDFIELYNHGKEAVNLQGWYLSDDKDNLERGKLPEVELLPGEYLLIYADGLAYEADAVPFKISAEGESLFLTDPDGNVVDSVVVPSLEYNTSYARTEDGIGEWERMETTPGKSNEGANKVRDIVLDRPQVSVASGFYDEPFELEIKAQPGERIYYTLDGSIPDKNSPIYEKPLWIEDPSNRPNVYNSIRNVVKDWLNYKPSEELVDKAVIVRALVMDATGNHSDIVTATYFIEQEQYQNADVISLTVNPDDMFGMSGIHVTGDYYDEWYLSGSAEEEPEPVFQKGGRKREIVGNIQFFETGKEVLNQYAGIRLQGEGSRGKPKKRFSIYSREEYSGSSYFEYELLGHKDIHSVVLNDGFANAFSQELVKERNVGTLQSRQVVVFLNGEYWYTTYMLEKYNKHYFRETYGVDPDNVVIIKEGNVDEGERFDSELYEQFLSFLDQTDLTDEGNYEKLNTIMDIQSYIDFMCSNIFLCNMDVSEIHNYTLWRVREPENNEYGDGRWRWLLYDMDFLEQSDLEFHQVSSRAEINSFSDDMKFTDVTYLDHFMMSRLMTSEQFRKQFVLSFLDMANTVFSPETVESKLIEWEKDISWNDRFFQERFNYIVPYMAEEFGLKGTLEEVTLQINNLDAGAIQLNTCMIDLAKGTWTGRYYTDYPITVMAVPKDGYCFTGWEGTVESYEDTLSSDVMPGGIVLKANFEKIEK